MGRRIRAGGGGEVDIAALDRSRVLVAIEVRARTTARTGRAAETVDAARCRRLGRTLAGIAAREPIGASGLRVDLVTAEPEPGELGRWRLRRIAGIGER